MAELPHGRRAITGQSVAIRAALLPAALAICVGLCACGGTSSPTASASVVTPPEDLAEARTNPVTVSPMPGTPDASPQSQISFLGAAGTQVSDVRVVGSRSGAHGGRLEAYSTGTGESFLPARPFIAGERVTVHALVGTGGGATSQPASTTFTIAHEAPVSQQQFPSNPGNPQAIQHYISAPGLTPSTVSITTPAAAGEAGTEATLADTREAGADATPADAEEPGTEATLTDTSEAAADATPTDAGGAAEATGAAPTASPDDTGQSEEAVKAEYRKIAERRVRLGLLLAEVGRSNNITVTQDEVNQAITREARRHPGHERQVLDFYRQNPAAIDTLRAPIFEDKVIDFIVELAKIGERKVTPQELLAIPDPTGEDAPPS